MNAIQQVIHANDQLRKHLKGGRVEVCHGRFDISDNAMFGLLRAVAAYDHFHQDSLHNEGVMLFEKFNILWFITHDIDGERVLQVWIDEGVVAGNA
jgi:hypothetical protein